MTIIVACCMRSVGASRISSKPSNASIAIALYIQMNETISFSTVFLKQMNEIIASNDIQYWALENRRRILASVKQCKLRWSAAKSRANHWPAKNEREDAPHIQIVSYSNFGRSTNLGTVMTSIILDPSIPKRLFYNLLFIF